jgi:hypothetical protein
VLADHDPESEQCQNNAALHPAHAAAVTGGASSAGRGSGADLAGLGIQLAGTGEWKQRVGLPTRQSFARISLGTESASGRGTTLGPPL